MARYVIPAILLAALGGAMLIATGGRAEPRAEFRFINRGSINILDPAQMSYMQDIRIARAIWEGLTALDPQTAEPMEGVAYVPPEISEDGRTYLFRLRPDARWSNGDPVTARDFVRGWRRAIEPGTADVYAELITMHVAGITEYVAWRSDFVGFLGLVRRLQRGQPIKLSDVRNALQSDYGGLLHDYLPEGLVDQPAEPMPAQTAAGEPEPNGTPHASEGTGMEPTAAQLPDKGDGHWLSVIRALRDADVNWRQLGDELLDRHIAELDERFSGVGVRAVEDDLLEVRLLRPTPYLLDLTAFSTYLPIHESIEILRERYEGRPLAESAILAYDPQWTKPDYRRNGYPGLITNGSYLLKDWVFKRRLLLEANPYYWARGRVRSRTVEMVDVEYANTAFMLYEQGFVDMITDLSTDFAPDLVRLMKEGVRDDIQAIPSFGTYYLNFNCRPTLWTGQANPLADARVRRALALAANKQEIVDHVVRLDNPVAHTLVPAGQIPGYRSPAGLGYDPDRARRELAEAGYPNGQGLPVLEYLYNRFEVHERIAQALKRMWERELAVRIDLVAKETKTFAEDRMGGRFMISRSGWFGDYVDPTTWLDLLHSQNSQNMAGFIDPHYDALLARAADEVDAEARLEILHEAERYIMEEQLPDLPLYVYVSVYGWRPNVKGIYPNPHLQFPLQYIQVNDAALRGEK